MLPQKGEEGLRSLGVRKGSRFFGPSHSRPIKIHTGHDLFIDPNIYRPYDLDRQRPHTPHIPLLLVQQDDLINESLRAYLEARAYPKFIPVSWTDAESHLVTRVHSNMANTSCCHPLAWNSLT